MLNINSINQNQPSFKSKITSSKFEAAKLERLSQYCKAKALGKDLFNKTSKENVIEESSKNIFKEIYRATSEKLAEQKFLRANLFLG